MGKFSDRVHSEWLSDGRTMKLLKSLSYIDKEGTEWNAPSGSLVDGASIPRFFWRFIGSPFSGKYRRASVIHDVYCNNEIKPSKSTHKVFREMMLTDEVPKLKAWMMWLAVRTFGPRCKGLKF